jgi:hypothetical protein
MGRNYLKGHDGDRINAVFAAAGYNFSLLLRYPSTSPIRLTNASHRFFTVDNGLYVVLERNTGKDMG